MFWMYDDNTGLGDLMCSINRHLLVPPEVRRYLIANPEGHPMLSKVALVREESGYFSPLRFGLFEFCATPAQSKGVPQYEVEIFICHPELTTRIYKTRMIRLPGTTLLRGPWHPDKTIPGWECSPDMRKQVVKVVKAVKKEIRVFNTKYRPYARNLAVREQEERSQIEKRIFKD